MALNTVFVRYPADEFVLLCPSLKLQDWMLIQTNMNLKTTKYLGALGLSLLLTTTFAQEKTVSANEFESAINSIQNEQLIDVRTPEEFAKGYIDGALNVDINGPDFKKHVATLDRSKPVMVYCLSGGRSSRAAEQRLCGERSRCVGAAYS